MLISELFAQDKNGLPHLSITLLLQGNKTPLYAAWMNF